MAIADFVNEQYQGHISDKHGSLNKGKLGERIIAAIAMQQGHGFQPTTSTIDKHNGVDGLFIRDNDLSKDIRPVSIKGTFTLPKGHEDRVRVPLCGCEAHSPIPSVFNRQTKKIWFVLSHHNVCLSVFTHKLIEAIKTWYPNEFEMIVKTPWRLEKNFSNSVCRSNMATAIALGRIYLRDRRQTKHTNVIIFPSISMLVKDADAKIMKVPSEYTNALAEVSKVI